MLRTPRRNLRLRGEYQLLRSREDAGLPIASLRQSCEQHHSLGTFRLQRALKQVGYQDVVFYNEYVWQFTQSPRCPKTRRAYRQ
jgi:hypothetical protein